MDNDVSSTATLSDMVQVTPWDYEGRWSTTWYGRFLAADDTDTGPFAEEDIASIIAAADSGDVWDGTVAAVLLLKDGRFVAYETFYGPTGDGFSEDAYGGDADVYFGLTLDAVVRLGLTDSGRRLCGIPREWDAMRAWLRERESI